VADTWVGFTPKDDPRDRIAIEVGDSQDLTRFYPQVKLMRWDDECNLSLRVGLANYVGATTTVNGTDIIWESSRGKFHFYEVPADEAHPEGGYEFEIILAKKPPTNTVTFTLRSKGLTAHYQRPLNQETPAPNWVTVTETEAFDAEGHRVAYRPPKAVGSYALYHDSRIGDIVGKQNYRAGKVGHIYRPHLTDALGAEAWGTITLDLVAQTCTITVPQDFLNSATYPVVIDPTFGYTTIGGTLGEYYADYEMAFGPYSPASNGDATSVSFYFCSDYHAAFSATFGIFSDTGSDAPNANLKDSAGGNVGNPDEVRDWYTQNLDSSLAITSTTLYWIVRNSVDTFHYAYDSVSGYDYVYDAATYSAGTLRSSYGTPDGRIDNWRHSCYVTYTEAAGGELYEQACAGGITPAGGLQKLTKKLVFAGGITPTGAIQKLTKKLVFAGGITPTGALGAAAAFFQEVAGSITPTGALQKLTAKSIGGAISPSGGIGKMTAKSPGGAITPTGALTAAVAYFQSVAGGITPTGALSRLITYAEAVAGAITPMGALQKLISKTIGGSITLAGTLGRIGPEGAAEEFRRSIYRWFGGRRR
jgi:hypothetical protein